MTLTLPKTGERVTRPGEPPFRTAAEELGVAMAAQFDSINADLDRLTLQRDLARAAFKVLSEEKADLEAENEAYALTVAELERERDEAEARCDAATRGRG